MPTAEGEAFMRSRLCVMAAKTVLNATSAGRRLSALLDGDRLPKVSISMTAWVCRVAQNRWGGEFNVNPPLLL